MDWNQFIPAFPLAHPPFLLPEAVSVFQLMSQLKLFVKSYNGDSPCATRALSGHTTWVTYFFKYQSISKACNNERRKVKDLSVYLLTKKPHKI